MPQDRFALDELSWTDVAAQIARDARLILPIGALEQHGPHLPLGTNVLIAGRIAYDLSLEFGVLRAPVVPYGVNVPSERAYAGTATLRAKTLHRMLNDLLATWESQGFDEFILITAHRHEPHLDALTTLATNTARVRVVSVWDVDVSAFLETQQGPLHAGEAETSLLLHLFPDRVRMDRARDFELPPEDFERYLHGRLPVPPPGGAGVVGHPTAATPEKGLRIYNQMMEAIRTTVLRSPATARISA